MVHAGRKVGKLGARTDVEPFYYRAGLQVRAKWEVCRTRSKEYNYSFHLEYMAGSVNLVAVMMQEKYTGQHGMVDSGLIGAKMAGGPDVFSHVQQEDDLDHPGCKVGKPGAGTVV